MSILGSIGLSVWAYATSQKTHEIGIRMALGAERNHVLGMAIRSALRLVVAGLAIGIAVGLLLGRLISTQLVGVTAYDPATLAVMSLLLTLTAAIACCIPAPRAASVDPAIALRYE